MIGLVVVAIGTSLPELSISLVAALKRDTEIVLRNIFYSLFVIGLAATNATISVQDSLLLSEFPLMLLLSALFCCS